MPHIYLRGHWHEDRLLRYDPDARTSEILKARELPRDQRYSVGRFQEVPEGHLFALHASARGPILVINDATEVPLREAELSIESGKAKDVFRVSVKGVEIMKIRYTPEYGDNWFEREDFELLFWLVKSYRDDAFVSAYTRTDPSPTWWLWLRDRFEYPPPPRVVVAAGSKLEAGYRELWKAHLREGIDDDAKDHFNEFILDTADESGERAVTLRGRAERAQMAELRRWSKESESPPFVLARAHVALVSRVADPVGAILSVVEVDTPWEDLESALSRLAQGA